jgi:hypothetical protein
MAAGNTNVAIATATASGSVATIDFTSIPQTYRDLVLVYNGTVAANWVWVRPNSDANANFSWTRLLGTGSSVSPGRVTRGAGAPNDRRLEIGIASTGEATTNIYTFNNYSNTTTLKTVLSRFNSTGSHMGAMVGLWNSTAAISTITVGNDNAANFASGSTFSLYGIEYA